MAPLHDGLPGATLRIYQDGQLMLADGDVHNAVGLAPASQNITLGRAAGGQVAPDSLTISGSTTGRWQRKMFLDCASESLCLERMKMRVTFYQRRPQRENFSVERVFADVRRSLPDDIDATVAVSRFASGGFFRRIYNMVEAGFRQGDVNHITGDVHFLAYFLRGNRTLLTIHDLVSVHRLNGFARTVFLFFWYWLPVRRAAVLSVVSEFTKKDLLRHIKVDPFKVRVVHNPVSADLKPAAREFNSAKPVVLQIGVGANKNVERVVQALQGIPCHLRVIGDLNDSQLTALRQCGVAYSSVSNIPDEQVVDEYRRCDMLVFASTYEGFGLPIIEAQATGRPVVTSKVGSMLEVAGDAACLVNPFDVHDIRRGVLQIISDGSYRNTLIANGYVNAQRFRPKLIANQYAQLYREIISLR